MSKFFKKLFGALSDKPWEKAQIETDNYHQGKTFDISLETSAVIVIFGVSTVLFTLVVTGYLYSIPAGQDTQYLFEQLCHYITITTRYCKMKKLSNRNRYVNELSFVRYN